MDPYLSPPRDTRVSFYILGHAQNFLIVDTCKTIYRTFSSWDLYDMDDLYEVYGLYDLYV